jgi:hypothetical protein
MSSPIQIPIHNVNKISFKHSESHLNTNTSMYLNMPGLLLNIIPNYQILSITLHNWVKETVLS